MLWRSRPTVPCVAALAPAALVAHMPVTSTWNRCVTPVLPGPEDATRAVIALFGKGARRRAADQVGPSRQKAVAPGAAVRSLPDAAASRRMFAGSPTRRHDANASGRTTFDMRKGAA